MKNYEVEIKSLLGSQENALKLKKFLAEKFPSIKLIASGKQLNHYFNLPKDLSIFAKKIIKIIPKVKQKIFKEILEHGHKLSVRSRETDREVILVIKASVGEDTSSNGVKRIEFEIPVKMSLAQLDELLLSTGCTYQAKWSREREEYSDEMTHVCIDKNAGYGYLAEFERVANDEAQLEIIRSELLEMMALLEVAELKQDRLERMFAHYNSHWNEYYGTEKTFIIE